MTSWDMLAIDPLGTNEIIEVSRLGKLIGFGRLMQLANAAWRDAAKEAGHAGSEFVCGPCAAMVVPCPHSERDVNGHCTWCCGAGWVTKRVREAMP